MVQLPVALLAILVSSQSSSDAKLVGIFGNVGGKPAYWKPDGTRFGSVPDFLDNVAGLKIEGVRWFVFEVTPGPLDLQQSPHVRASLPNEGGKPNLRPLMPLGSNGRTDKKVWMTALQRFGDGIKETDITVVAPNGKYETLWAKEKGKPAVSSVDDISVTATVKTSLDGKPINNVRGSNQLEAEFTNDKGWTADTLEAFAVDNGKETRPRSFTVGQAPDQTEKTLWKFGFDVSLLNADKVEIRRAQVSTKTFSHVALNPRS